MNTSTQHTDTGLPSYIFTSRYARFHDDAGRRETLPEATNRVRGMHLRRFADKGPRVVAVINDAFDAVGRLEVLPSMRSLQFGGRAIEANPGRIFNCSFTHIDRVAAFSETFYMLLLGCGVGFSVQKQHVAELPALGERSGERVRFEIPDTIEGWALALDRLVRGAIAGETVDFDYSLIRPAGSALKTTGGIAPGPEPLRTALIAAEMILREAAGRQLRPIEAYDVLMFAAKAVLSGGVRRSATICLFSVDDDEMTHAKTGDWFSVNPQRASSNNSAVLVRGQATMEQFSTLFEAVKQFGEPGFIFVSDADYGVNPCAEIGLFPVFNVRSESDLELARAYGVKHDNKGRPLTVGSRVTGFQMCNLSTISAAAVDTPADFYAACRHAAAIGTLQAAYTDIPFLSPVSRLLNERESLIGVSICGILDKPEILLDPKVLRQGAEIVKRTNHEVATLLGIAPAARTTCVKPEGTASLMLGTSSGIHARHARKYFRRVQANRRDPVYQTFAAANPHMVEASVYGPNDDVITFAVEAPGSAMIRSELPALQFLNNVRTVQENWVMGGTADQSFAPGLTHNVSNTVNVKPSEWNEVADYIWQGRDLFGGVSLLSDDETAYRQAPHQTVATTQDAQHFEAIRDHFTAPDYEGMSGEDVTAGHEHRGAAVACSGGACSLV